MNTSEQQTLKQSADHESQSYEQQQSILVNAPSRKLRVLVIAEAANPEWVSVPLVGWSHYQAIAKLTDAHLVTHVRNGEAIEKILPSDHFTLIDSEKLARPLWKIGNIFRGGAGKGWTTMMAFNALSYYYFENLVWKRFATRLINGEFDVVHRITPLSPTIPSLLAKKCHHAGVPFVVGPLNGGVPWPKAFSSARRDEREWLSYVRDAYKLLPGYRSMRRYASAIVTGSRDTHKQLPAQYREKAVFVPENGIDPDLFSKHRIHEAKLPLKLIFVGRLVPYKGADMLVEAVAPLAKSGKVLLTIVGDGPQKASLQNMIEAEKLTSSVDLRGWVEHKEIQRHLIEADLLTFPSIREFGGGVALEAMAVGLVPLVVEYGGLADLVTNESGYLIPLKDRQSIIEQIRLVIDRIIANPGEIERKSHEARRVVQNMYTWDAKAHQTLQIYKWVAGISKDKPDWGMPFNQTSIAAASCALLKH